MFAIRDDDYNILREIILKTKYCQITIKRFQKEIFQIENFVVNM